MSDRIKMLREKVFSYKDRLVNCIMRNLNVR